MHYLELLISLVFIVDVFMGFRKGYINEITGKHERDGKLIAIRYIKFYFWIDLLSCIPFNLFVNSMFFRLISLIKVVRLFRFKKII